jgi:hypothetical protein
MAGATKYSLIDAPYTSKGGVGASDDMERGALLLHAVEIVTETLERRKGSSLGSQPELQTITLSSSSLLACGQIRSSAHGHSSDRTSSTHTPP